MNWKSCVGHVSVILLLASSVGCEDRPVATSAPSTDAAPPAQQLTDAPQPKPARKIADARSFSGAVSALGADWVELGVGWECQTRKKVTLDPKKPVRLSAAGTQAGGNPDGEGEAMTYHVSDLKVGDQVMILTNLNRQGEEWIARMTVYRRPGGKIPPPRNDLFAGTGQSLYLRYQAEQDWEEKGIPIPQQHLDNGRAWWTNPPYPPAAPMPRVALPAPRP